MTVSGSDSRSAGHQGSLTLVTPFRLSSHAFGLESGFATQVLTFVPEPGTLVFFLSGAGLLLLARNRLS